MSDEQIAAACLTLIDTALSTYGPVTNAVKAIDLDDARGVTLEHVQVTLSRRTSASERAGREAQAPYRLTTRPVANTVSNGRELDRRVFAALNGATVTDSGETSTPFRLESADPIGEDDNRYSGLSTWTFVL